MDVRRNDTSLEEFEFTRVVATLGPATSKPDEVRALLNAGVDVCRLNFSHGTHAEHAARLECIRSWEAENERPIAVLGDLCGPKIRLSRIEDPGFEIAPGEQLRFRPGVDPSSRDAVYISYERLLDDIEVGHRLLIDDGLLRLLVVERNRAELVATCLVGGRVTSRKGVNLPDSSLCTHALTDKDREDLGWAIANKLDFVALSFVRKPDDVRELRDLIRAADSPLKIISKIEKPEALAHLDEILELSDGLMAARGDLGVEMDIWRVPLAQKDITRRCRRAAKPVIIATQMLQSMVESPTPTRAEVSDVANAILDQADATMLSAESAAGKYPLESVEMMRRIARYTETYRNESRSPRPFEHEYADNPATNAIALAAAQAALRLQCKLVAVWTSSGRTVRLVARQRLPMPVVGLTYSETVVRQMNLLYGVIPIRIEPSADPGALADDVDRVLIERGLARRGDLIVVVTSTNPTSSGQTNTTLIHRVGEARAGSRFVSYSI